MIAVDDYLYFADRAFRGMAGIVVELGDERANTRAYAGANAPYALLHHCLAVVETWVGGFVCGRPVERDRAAEFDARGCVDDLVARTEVVRTQLHADVAAASPDQPLRCDPPAEFLGPTRSLNQGAALQHVFEELAQHHGQMETLRDILVLTPTIAEV